MKISKNIIFTILALTIASYDMPKVVERLTSLGCQNLSTNNHFNDWYMDVYREITVKNPFTEVFDIPLSFPMENGHQLTLFSLARNNNKESDTQIEYILNKLENLFRAQLKVKDFKKLGIQQNYNCYYKQKKVVGFKTEHITRVLFEEDPLPEPIKDSVKSFNSLLYLIQQLLRTYKELEPAGFIFFDLTIEDFFVKKIGGSFVQIILRNDNLGAFDKTNILGIAKERLASLAPAERYQFPGYIVSAFKKNGKLEEWHFGPFFNRWRLALVILELCGVDIRAVFDSPACDAIYADTGCQIGMSYAAEEEIKKRFKDEGNDWAKLWAVRSVIQDLMVSKDAKKMDQIISDFEKDIQ